MVRGISSRFNPRTRTGCDTSSWFGAEFIDIGVSTHAPARGATAFLCSLTSYSALSCFQEFQPTHPHGVRLSLVVSPWARRSFRFQPTHPHGVRHQTCMAYACDLEDRFNPRTRTGCDACALLHRSTCRRFNPRTRTGCDSRLFPAAFPFIVSTHAPARGATPMAPAPANAISPGCFNPRTRTGCDIRAQAWTQTSCLFQPTHPHGVRRHWYLAGVILVV
jgi:hypothetical protein